MPRVVVRPRHGIWEHGFVRRGISVIATFATLIAALAVIPSRSVQAATPNAPAPASLDGITWIPQLNSTQALDDLAAGRMDMYTLSLSSQNDIATARSNPNLRVLDTVGVEDDLFINPVPTDELYHPGKMNPFALRPVREAMNYLIDRDHIAAAFLGGFGVPHVSPWPPNSPDFGRNARFLTELTRNTSYDPRRAHDLVFAAMNTTSAVLQNGTWMYKGTPVDVNIVIWIEGVRRDIGNYIATQVETLGFAVNRLYLQPSIALSTVYSGPPDANEWHLYTEEWSTKWMDGWPDDLLWYFPNAGKVTDGWPDDLLWYYHDGGDGTPVWSYHQTDPALHDVATRLLNTNYATVAERRALLQQGAQLAFEDSVRVWLVADRATVSSPRVTAFTYDLSSGPWSFFSTRTARFASPGGTLLVGQPVQALAPYQPWMGFDYWHVPEFWYDRLISFAFQDPGVWVHPHTGSYIPVRSNFTVATAGPTGSLDLPVDAMFYNASVNQWTPVAQGSTATSKVTFDYTFGPWHDGASMSIDDVLYEIALLMRRDHGDIAGIDPYAVAPMEHRFVSAFRGLRVVDAHTLEVYVNAWHVDPGVIAHVASVFPRTPWEVGEIAMATVLADETRLSREAAFIHGRDQLDLARGPSIGFLNGHLAPLTAANARPPGADTYPGGGITVTEATDRWAALGSWQSARGHYYVSNGPYSFVRIEEANAPRVYLTRFADYPFPADRWDFLLTPRVPSAAIDPIGTVTIGARVSIRTTTTLGGKPTDNVTLEYLITNNDTGSRVLRGGLAHAGPGAWTANLSRVQTRTLTPGPYVFEVFGVGSEASITVTASAPFLASGVDTTPPVSSLSTLSSSCFAAGAVPVHVNSTADDDASGVASVELFYSYSADGVTYGPRTSLGSTAGPYEWIVDPVTLGGEGSYRLWAVATDAAGNRENLSAKSPAGDVAFRYDATAPTVVQTTPANGATAVAPDTAIVVVFSEQMDTVGTSVSLSPAAGALDQGFDASGMILTARHGPLSPSTTYTLSTSTAFDACGNALPPFSSAFTTAAVDTVAPTSALGPSGAYWYRTGPVGLTASALDDASGVARVELFASYSGDNATWSTPGVAAMDTSAPYGFAFSPTSGDGYYRLWTVAVDIAGNRESLTGKPATGDVSIAFDSAPPTVLSTAPAQGADGVAVSIAEIAITFSEPVDRALAEAAFSIEPATVGTFAWDGNRMKFRPQAPLRADTSYTVRVGSGVRDRAGNLLAADFALSFRTAAPGFIESAGLPIGIAVVGAVLLAVALVLLRRRRRGGEPRQPPR